MKHLRKINIMLILPWILMSVSCDKFLEEDTDLCEKYKRPATVDQKVRVHMDAYRNQPYPDTELNILNADFLEVYITIRLMNCERVEADFRQINFAVYPFEEVPFPDNHFEFTFGPVEEFSTTNESDYLSVQYHFYATFNTLGGRNFISDTIWSDYTSWTTSVPGETFKLWISVPQLWYEQ